MFIQSASSVANTPISFIRNRRRPRTASGLGQDRFSTEIDWLGLASV